MRTGPAARSISVVPLEANPVAQRAGLEAIEALAVTQPPRVVDSETLVRRADVDQSRASNSASRGLVSGAWDQRNRLVLFAANGMNVFALGLLIQVILVRYAGMGHVSSYVVQTVASVQLSFLLSRYVTWRDRDLAFVRAATRFNVQQLAVTGLGMAGYAGLERLGMNYITANVAITAVLTPVSFVSSHKWSMDERTPRRRRPGRKLASEEDGAPTVTFPAIADEILTTAVEPAHRGHRRPPGRSQLRRFLVFGSIGMFVFLVGTALQRVLLKPLGTDGSYIWQTVFSVELSYVLNRWLTWPDRNVPVLSSLVKWNAQKLVLTVPNIVCYDLLMRAGMNWLVANLAATAAFTVVNYVTADKWTFIRGTLKLRRPALLPLLSPLLILGVQTGLALRLVWSNTAYGDEGLYLRAGHLEIAHILHGTQIPVFSSYFSGAPVIYPIIGALANNLGGLTGARILSMCFMLGATVLLWAITRRLYGELAAFFAAAMWALLGPTLFLSAYATFDAMSVFLLVLAAWLATARRASGNAAIMMVAAGATLTLANFTTYSTIIFDPVVVLLAILSARPQLDGKTAVRRGLLLGAVTSIAIYSTLLFAGSSYLQGVRLTVLARSIGTDKPSTVLIDALLWTGVVAVIAVAGVILAAMYRKTADLWLLGLLAAAVLLVPLEQAHIHTTTSLQKHVDIGAWFAAIAAGYALSKLVTVWRSRVVRTFIVTIVLGGVTLMGVTGFTQAKMLFGQWPNSTSFVATMRPLVASTHGPILIESSQTLAYYLPSVGYDWQRWSDTYSAYLPSGVAVGYYPGKSNVGGNPSVFEALIKHGYFSLIELDDSFNYGFDQTISAYLEHDSNYRVVARVSFGSATYPVWKYVGPKVGGQLPGPPITPPYHPSAIVEYLLMLLLAVSVIILLAETAVALVSVN